VLVAVGDTHAVGRERIRLDGEHREAVQIGTLVEHLARLGPGAVQQDEQRLLAGGQYHLAGQAVGRFLAGGKDHVGLPDGIRQQGQQLGMGFGTRPEKGPGGVRQHVGDEAPGVGGLHGLAVIHHEAETGLGLERRAPVAGTPVVAQLAGIAAWHAAATGKKGSGRDALAPDAQAVDGVIGDGLHGTRL